MRDRQRGFTFIELIIIIVVVSILGVVAISRYISISQSAEKASFQSVTGSLRSALDIYSVKQIASSQTIAAHNPFDDLAVKPSSYAGEFGDVNDTNCQPGQWADQSGDSSNGSWGVVVYRPQSTLTQAFVWNNIQWIVLVINPVLDSSGTTVGLSLDYYPPTPQW